MYVFITYNKNACKFTGIIVLTNSIKLTVGITLFRIIMCAYNKFISYKY